MTPPLKAGDRVALLHEKVNPFDGVRPAHEITQSGAAGFRVVEPRADRAGADPSEWPEDLRVREFPKGGA
jgi:hypothetical protein